MCKKSVMTLIMIACFALVAYTSPVEARLDEPESMVVPGSTEELEEPVFSSPYGWSSEANWENVPLPPKTWNFQVVDTYIVEGIVEGRWVNVPENREVAWRNSSWAPNLYWRHYDSWGAMIRVGDSVEFCSQRTGKCVSYEVLPENAGPIDIPLLGVISANEQWEISQAIESHPRMGAIISCWGPGSEPEERKVYWLEQLEDSSSPPVWGGF